MASRRRTPRSARQPPGVAPPDPPPDPSLAEPVEADTARASGRNLRVAIFVGVALGGLFLGSLFWHPLAFTLVVAGFVVVAMLEAATELRRVGVPTSVPVMLLGGLMTVLGAYRSHHAGQAVGMMVLFVSAVVWLLADPERKDVVRNLATTVLLGVWVGFLASFGVLLVNRPDDGPVAVLAVIGAAALGDIGAYAIGVPFGRTRIAPRVSPSKTVEGLAGGVVVAAVLAAIVLPLVGDLFTPLTAVAVAVVSVLAGFLGDLTESMIKRDLRVKDFGTLLPGHGGILDRVDGILMAMPVGFFAIAVLT